MEDGLEEGLAFFFLFGGLGFLVLEEKVEVFFHERLIFLKLFNFFRPVNFLTINRPFSFI